MQIYHDSVNFEAKSLAKFDGLCKFAQKTNDNNLSNCFVQLCYKRTNTPHNLCVFLI